MKKANQASDFFSSKSCQVISLLITVVMVVCSVLLPALASYAAAPAAGTLSPNTTPPVTNVNWVGTDAGPAAPNGEADCAGNSAASPVCDTFVLTLSGTFADWNAKRARVQINWRLPTTDYDMYIHTGSENGPIVATSAAGATTFEQADLDPNALGTLGPFYIRVVYFAATAADQYNGVASAVNSDPPYSPPASACALPTYQTYKPPCATPDNPAACNAAFRGYNTAGEPSIGVNWNTGNVLFQSGFATLRATFNDSTSPATAIWASTRPQNVISLDPIMFTDPTTGRTIPGQLNGATSKQAITDNDGETYLDTVEGLASGIDHQSLGAGPYKANVINPATNTVIGPTTSYPNAWYYASQSVAAGLVARSDNGGIIFGPQVPIYNIAQCSGLHGHVKVAPDGTVYVPNKNCPDPDLDAATADGGQGVTVSEDNGLTWKVRTLPGSGSGDSDPSLGIGAGGRVFFAYTAGDKTIRAAVSDNKGVTWKFDHNIGKNVEIAPGVMGDIKATVFPAVHAGDNNRATIFFLGTGSSGPPGDPTGTDNAPATGPDPNLADNFSGTWYAYMATTCNGGRSWSVVRVGDPVQQGVICTNGTTCPQGPPDTRNLLDFNDVQVDRFGRPVAAYADGCVTTDCIASKDRNGDRKLTKEDNDGTEVASIIRQVNGPRLFADFDAGGPAAPSLPPSADVTSTFKGANLAWQTPDDGGSPITGYRIYRGIGDREPQLIKEVVGNTHSFRDKMRSKSGAVYYQVTVMNAYGESPRTRKFYVGQSPSKTE